MYLFGGGFSSNPPPFPGSSFDDLLPDTPASRGAGSTSPGFLNPSDLAIKQEEGAQSGPSATTYTKKPPSPSASSGSSQGSSSSSTKYNSRYTSEKLTVSPPVQGSASGAWSTGINGLKMPSGEDMFADTDMTGFDADFEASNQQMASDFDFETAASTPSGFDTAPLGPFKTAPAVQPFHSTHTFNPFIQHKTTSPRLPAAKAHFYVGESRESSPLNTMLPTQTQTSWNKHSPSSGLEETFNGITMNGDSPGNATFSPNMQFSNNGFSFDPESSATPSSFAKDISSPPSTVNSTDGPPQLFVQPTSVKSRVETQIPIRMTLSPLPAGVTKLRLPTHTISKPKFLSKPEAERSSEILELYTSLVCTSAMQDQSKLDRAFARARGEEVGIATRPSPTSSLGSHSSRDDEDKPLNGGEVRICSGCIQRERKRASRKKQKKVDEEELFQKDEEKRVIVFNTNEVKEWGEPAKDAQGTVSGLPNNVPPSLIPGAMQVELPMRIACYCRHQNEKMGFQVIFTIKDHTDKVIAQAITNSIMITDDHKTHNAPTPAPQPSGSIPNAPHLPGAGVFQSSGLEYPGNQATGGKMFKQSFSTTDLSGLQHNFNPNFPMTATSTPFAVPSAISTNTSATLTPRNLSRPASPSGPSGPTTKRRKQSGSGKIPSNLTMTRLETSQTSGGSSTMPNSAATSPFPTMMMNTADRGFAMPGTRQGQFGTSPPTPNSHETAFMHGVNGINRSWSMENFPRQAIISAPSSRQPSRPGSPSSNRNSFGAADPGLGQAVSSQLFGQSSRRPPPTIHKLVPAEGSVTGGTEVTLLGNGFYQGLEVMFGDTEATTTTFWGEKCLCCIAPPAIQPGTVTVVFKHEHHQYTSIHTSSQTRHPVFTYTDERNVEMMMLALKTLGKNLQHPTDDPYSAAQQVLGGPSPSFWHMQGGYGGSAGHHRQAIGANRSSFDPIELESNMLALLDYLDLRGISDYDGLNGRQSTGITLLHFAASLGLTRFVAGLLSRGAIPDVLDNNGNTPMHHAAMNGHAHIIHRLRISGANNRIRSIRTFIPADLATSLLSHQAAVIPHHHYRSRSAGGTPMRLQSRNTSSTSLKSFWDNTSTNYAYSEDSDDTGNEAMSQYSASLELPVVIPRRPSTQLEISRPSPLARRSAQGGGTRNVSQPIMAVPDASGSDQAAVSPPAAFMMAWRDHIAAQIHQFQESAHWTMPNLPTLPALPTLPDYQAYPMVRRVSSLFPQRPTSRPGTAPGSREGWWETLTGSSSPSAPPAYNELYPEPMAEEDLGVKKASALQAAADAALDHHFEETSATEGSLTGGVQVRQDRKQFYIWVSPCLLRGSTAC